MMQSIAAKAKIALRPKADKIIANDIPDDGRGRIQSELQARTNGRIDVVGVEIATNEPATPLRVHQSGIDVETLSGWYTIIMDKASFVPAHFEDDVFTPLPVQGEVL